MFLLGSKLGYDSTIIRQLNAYIPSNDKDSPLLPYSRLLFLNEDPNYLSKLLKNVSSIRLYLYGNSFSILNNWSELIIEDEDQILNDEDNWSAFIENEFVQDFIKWNFAFLFGKKWKISRVSPLNLDQLGENPRFQSALHRSHLTYSQRQIELTSQIFDWYNKSLEQGFIHIEPKLSKEEESIKLNRFGEKNDFQLSRRYPFRNVSTFDYNKSNSNEMKSFTFIWFDQLLNDCEDYLNEIIFPYQWNFSNKIVDCIVFIEKSLLEKKEIFLIISGSIGNELFYSGISCIKQIRNIYIYCSHILTHQNWSKDYSQIRGVFNQSNKLAQQIKEDYYSLKKTNSNEIIQSITTEENKFNENVEDDQYLNSFPMIVYSPCQSDFFFSYQLTIDSLLCMPHTEESKIEMIEQFRQMYSSNQSILNEIDDFERNYHSDGAVQWYTKDSFVSRTINKILRSTDIYLMLKLRYILTDIYYHLNQSYKQIRSSYYYPLNEIFYRGQILSNDQFEYLKQIQGDIISIKTFFSTTTSMQIALLYAGKYFENFNFKSILFIIEKNSNVDTRPYANISQYSLFPDEDEVLFSMGTIFRIGNIRLMNNEDQIWIIHLHITDKNDLRFK